jgi:hypothetical protein
MLTTDAPAPAGAEVRWHGALRAAQPLASVRLCSPPAPGGVMSLEERIRQSVGHALDDMRGRMEVEIRAIVQELSSAAEERQTAMAEETRAPADIEQRLAEARAKELEQVTLEVRNRLMAEADARLRTAAEEADSRLLVALDEAEKQAALALDQSVAAARIDEREFDMAGLSRLLDAIRGLDGATSLSNVLDVLGQAAGCEAGRAALLVLRGDRVQGWKLAGFGPLDAQPRSVELPLAEAGIIAAAASGSRVVTTHEGHGGRGPGFAGLSPDRIGMAVPVVVGGRTVAVLYADTAADAEREVTVPSGWPEVVEILARHAARCLEALTVQRVSQSPPPRFWVPSGAKPASSPSQGASGGSKEPPLQVSAPDAAQTLHGVEPEESARRLARLLISEIKLFHEAAVHEGRTSGTLLARLGPEIDRARRAYDTRIPSSLATRGELFQQELIATLAGGDASLLGAPA